MTPAAQPRPVTTQPTGWDLIVYVDTYCRTKRPEALAALAHQQRDAERLARLAAFFSTAHQAFLRRTLPGPVPTEKKA